MRRHSCWSKIHDERTFYPACCASSVMYRRLHAATSRLRGIALHFFLLANRSARGLSCNVLGGITTPQRFDRSLR